MFAPNWKRLLAKVRCKYRCPRGLSSGWELRPDWPSEHLQLLPSHQFLQFGSYTLEWIAATSTYHPHQQDFWLKHNGRFVRFLFWNSNDIIKRERKLAWFNLIIELMSSLLSHPFFQFGSYIPQRILLINAIIDWNTVEDLLDFCFTALKFKW